MESDLKSASKYVNNLLMSRGLLKDSLPIAFANPTESDDTPSRIINLVHDLINKRDRDAEHRENLAMTIRTLKATEEENNATIERLRENCEAMNRRCAILQGQERILNQTSRAAEARSKSLKEETARLKTAVERVRTQCANDIRKRDIQISRMKEKLLDATRGGRGNKQSTAVPGVTLSVAASASMSAINGGGVGGSGMGSDYDPSSLTNETTSFLTQLSQSLSDENETLASMMRNTVATIRAISGMDTSTEDGGASDGEEDGDDGEGRLVIAKDASHSQLVRDLDHVLYELKELLNQPNYVPVEDLLYRDREIDRLKNQVKGLHVEWRKAIELVEIVNRRSASLTAKESTVLGNVIERGKRTVLEELHLNYEPANPVDTFSSGKERRTTMGPAATDQNGNVNGEEMDLEAEISAHLSLINPISPNVLEDKSYTEQFSPIKRNNRHSNSYIETPSILKPQSAAVKKHLIKSNSKKLTKINPPVLRR